MASLKLSPMSRRLTFEFYNNNALKKEGKSKNVFLRFLLLNKSHLYLGKRFIYGAMLRGHLNYLYLKSDYFEPQRRTDNYCSWPCSNKMTEREVLLVYRLLNLKDQFLNVEFKMATEWVLNEIVERIEGSLKLETSNIREKATNFIHKNASRIVELSCSPVNFIATEENPLRLKRFAPKQHPFSIKKSSSQAISIEELDFSQMAFSMVKHFLNDNHSLQVSIVTMNFYMKTGFDSLWQMMGRQMFSNAKIINLYLTMPWRGVEPPSQLQRDLQNICQNLNKLKGEFLGRESQQWNFYSNVLHTGSVEDLSQLKTRLSLLPQFKNFKFDELPLIQQRAKGFKMTGKKESILFDFKFKFQI